MKSVKSAVLFALTAILVLSGCGKHPDKVTVRIIASTDVHGFIFDKDLITQTERDGSLAKLSTFLKRERKENRNVIYLDAGDVLQGSVELYQDFTAQYFRTCVVSQAYNLLGCDAMAMGNHDVAAGPVSCDRFLKSADFPMLGANVFVDDTTHYLPPYRIIDKQGFRIAVLGMTTAIVNYSVPQNSGSGLEIHDMVETAAYWVPLLKEKLNADAVVGLFHSGLENGRMDDEGVFENATLQVVNSVPGFDLVIYGHDHVARRIMVPTASGDSLLLINPGPYANQVAALTLTADYTVQDKPVVTVSGGLVDITAEEPDQSFLKELSGWYSDIRSYSDSILGTIRTPLECNGALWRDATGLDYAHAIQMRYFGAEVSLTSPVATRTYFPAGQFSMRDAFNAFQYENNLVSVMLKGSEIKDILEYSSDLFYNTVHKKGDRLLKTVTYDDGTVGPEIYLGNFITAAGIDYTVDVTNPAGSRVNILSMADGSKFDLNRMYRTTMSSYTYFGAESPLFKATGLKRKDLPRRLNGASSIDIRYYMLTDFALNGNTGVKVTYPVHRKLIPEALVQDCLGKDTLNFSFIH